jgi:hypothetical protein
MNDSEAVWDLMERVEVTLTQFTDAVTPLVQWLAAVAKHFAMDVYAGIRSFATLKVSTPVVSIPDIDFSEPAPDPSVEVRKGFGLGDVGATGPAPSSPQFLGIPVVVDTTQPATVVTVRGGDGTVVSQITNLPVDQSDVGVIVLHDMFLMPDHPYDYTPLPNRIPRRDNG